MRRAARKDSNHNEIAAAFEAFKCSVLDLSRQGENCPDILVGFRGRTALVEVKSKRGKLSLGQQEFCQTWRGKVYVARSVDDVPVIVKQLLEGI